MRFLPEPIVDEVLARTDGDARIHPELLTGTVLFGDLRGFTSFAEGRPVDEVIEAINTYLTLMTDAVLDHGGTLVDYMGDGIMAAFGAPVANDEHADLALAAARAMAGEQLATFNAWLSSTGVEEPLRMGIGINSGPVLSGSVGSPRRLDYAVIGDTTNTASRIEAMTKQLDHAVLFSERTKDALHELPEDAVSLGEFEIRGRSASIELWALDVEEPDVTALDDEIRALRDRVAELEASEADRDRAERVQAALYRIAETASAAQDMQAFYAEMHRIVGELMYADNFYIVLYDEERQAMNWPFYVDTVDEGWPDPNVWESMGTGDARGITAYLLRTGQPAVADVRATSRSSFAGARST